VTELSVCAALRIEARAAKSALPGVPVTRVGMRAGNGHVLATDGPVALIGFGGGLDPSVAVGEVVVATEIRTPSGGVFGCADADALAAALSDAGLRVRLAPVAGSDSIVHGSARAALAASSGAVAVDMESAIVGALVGERRYAVVRVIVDTASSRIARPSIISDGLRAYRTLKVVARALPSWAAGLDQHDTLSVPPGLIAKRVS
jgi:4-hydroxy-3-methylbut-2-en-1-yl diphosphate reductase